MGRWGFWPQVRSGAGAKRRLIDFSKPFLLLTQFLKLGNPCHFCRHMTPVAGPQNPRPQCSDLLYEQFARRGGIAELLGREKFRRTRHRKQFFLNPVLRIGVRFQHLPKVSSSGLDLLALIVELMSSRYQLRSSCACQDACALLEPIVELRWAKTRAFKTDTRVSKRTC